MRTFSANKPPENPRRASVMVHGLTGGGKTTRALEGGRPLVICLEPKAEAHVLNLNPSATCWVPESCQDLEKIFEWLGSPKLADGGFTRIVLDSYTELTENLPNWILKRQNPGVGLEIGRQIELQEYKPVQSWGIALVRSMQLSGLPSIIIARSESKKVGREQRIVPAGLGSSVQGLPAQLVPTVEARWDEELQVYVWDSRPDASSQRCGLKWVPQVFNGTADEFLALVESGVAATPITTKETSITTATATHGTASPVDTEETRAPQPAAQSAGQPGAQGGTAPQPIQPSPEWVQAIAELATVTLQVPMDTEKRNEIVCVWTDKDDTALPDLLKAIEALKAQVPKETPREALQSQQGEALARKAPISDATHTFVDSMAEGKVKTHISDGQWVDLQQVVADHAIDMDRFEAYCQKHDYLMDSGPSARRPLGWMKPAQYTRILPLLKDANKRRALVAHLNTMNLEQAS